jgi:N-acetylglucosamine-6-phosphate deacetylase
METVLIKNVSLAAKRQPSELISILVIDGKFADTFSSDKNFAGATTLDFEGLQILPGFIDVHNHGAVGVDVNEADADGLLEIGRFLAKHGVTAWMPTLVPDSDDNYRRVISEIDRLMLLQKDQNVAQAVGVHYEGVFANEKMCGALRPEYFNSFTGTQVDELPHLRHGVHMTTFAPEVEGGVPLAYRLVQEGWVASIGHTSADIETLDKAYEAGARHITHFYNAMTGLHHRDVGVVGWALTNPHVTFDIIADGIHSNPKMLDFACRTKTPEKVALISDSVAPTGLGDGPFELWGETITVENGRTRNERGSIAGSVITMLDAVNNMRRLGFSNNDVALMASRNPARLLGIDAERGSIELGKRADFTALDSEGDVVLTMIGGRVVFDAQRSELHA